MPAHMPFLAVIVTPGETRRISTINTPSHGIPN